MFGEEEEWDLKKKNTNGVTESNVNFVTQVLKIEVPI
jgi:hypothetical protein